MKHLKTYTEHEAKRKESILESTGSLSTSTGNETVAQQVDILSKVSLGLEPALRQIKDFDQFETHPKKKSKKPKNKKVTAYIRQKIDQMDDQFGPQPEMEQVSSNSELP